MLAGFTAGNSRSADPIFHTCSPTEGEILRAKVERALEWHGQGADSIIRPTNIPMRNERPGIGFGKQFSWFPNILMVGRLANQKGCYTQITPCEGLIGRPIAANSDFGEPEAPYNQKYDALRVEMLDDDIGHIALYGLRINNPVPWVEIDGLRHTVTTQCHDADAERFMRTSLEAPVKEKDQKTKPLHAPIYSVTVGLTITTVPSPVSAL